MDEIIIGGKGSFEDFEASLNSRKIEQPKKKTIKESVPFSNTTYDFSAINGELYWNERTLVYVFEIIADTPEELEEKKAAFADWVMNVQNEDIFDPFIFDYHFNGTYEDMTFEDDEGLDKTTASVTFTAYPYKISNYPKVHRLSISAGATITVTLENNSSHRITPLISTTDAINITFNDTSYSIGAGEVQSERLALAVGLNTFVIKNETDGECALSISFYEEVL